MGKSCLESSKENRSTDNSSYRHNLKLPNSQDVLTTFQNFLSQEVAFGNPSLDTKRTYLAQARQFLAWCKEKGIAPQEGSYEHIVAYRSYLQEKGYQATTISLKLEVVRRFYDGLNAKGICLANPTKQVKSPFAKTVAGERVKWLPLSAIQSILQAPLRKELKGKRDLAILTLLALHGLRVIEVERLKVFDVDLALRRVDVLGKGNKRRTILLTEKTAAVLAEWMKDRPNCPSEALFFDLTHSDFQGALTRRGIRKMVDGYLKKLSLKRQGVSCHSLRHSFATLARSAGAKLDAISLALGHSSVTTTQIYADIVDKERENPANFLVALLERSA